MCKRLSAILILSCLGVIQQAQDAHAWWPNVDVANACVWWENAWHSGRTLSANVYGLDLYDEGSVKYTSVPDFRDYSFNDITSSISLGNSYIYWVTDYSYPYPWCRLRYVKCSTRIYEHIWYSGSSYWTGSTNYDLWWDGFTDKASSAECICEVVDLGPASGSCSDA